MKKKTLLFLVGLLGFSVFFCGCSRQGGGGTPTLVYYLWGGPGPAQADLLNAINQKLKDDINAVLEVRYIDWADVATRYPLLFASGEPYDMSHAGPNTPVSYFTLASQGAFADITDKAGTVTPALNSEIPAAEWNTARYKGRIYGVPSLYTGFNIQGFVHSRNLLQKYGLPPVNSVETMEAYLDAVAQNESFLPLNINAGDHNGLYRLFVAMTDQWIDAPGLPFNQNYLVAENPNNFREVIHPAFTQEFMDWAIRMHGWNEKGYWSRDVLSASISGKDNFIYGNSGGFITHQPDWTGAYGWMNEVLPGVVTDFWAPTETRGKIIKNPGVQDTTAISANSRNVDLALKAIEKFMTEQSYYDLIQYGIRGRQFDVVNGFIVQPPGFDEEKDGAGFSVWALRNDRFVIPYESEDPRRYTLNDEWSRAAIIDPFVGFAFTPNNVNTQIASVTNVNSQIGVQIMLGRTPDPRAAVEQYRQQLIQAGINDIIAEVRSQLASYTP